MSSIIILRVKIYFLITKGVWVHEISFVEPTLLLEFKTVDNINFSKATGNDRDWKYYSKVRQQNAMYYTNNIIKNGNKEFLQNLIKSIFSLHTKRSINTIYYDDVGKGTEEIQNTTLFAIMYNGISSSGYFTSPTTKNYSLFQLQFKILYQTELNLNVNIVKDLYKEGNFKKEININQNNNIVDLDKFVSYAKDSLISTGNEELQYVKVVSSYDDCFKLGQYNSDGFVVNQVINMQHRELWYSRMTATKDFQNANGFYKPSQTLVKYAIDKDNIFNRQCVIKDTVILDIVNEINTYSFLNDIYLSSFNFNDDNKDIYFTNSAIIVKSKNGYYDNVTYNKIEFNSPILAGKSIGPDNTVKLVFYTDAYRIDGNTYTNGELIRSWFEIGKLDLSSNAIYGIKKIPQYASQKNLYPYSKLIMLTQ